MQPLDTALFILKHPLGRQRPVAALSRYIGWQIMSRFRDELIINWIEGAVLGVKRGMTGVTGNIYCGLHEFTEMAFLLHLLRPGDLFLDIGANVGSYTVLASKVCGARSIAFEPDQAAVCSLLRNIALNRVTDLARVEQTALGAYNGEIAFTVGLDTMNRVATERNQKTQIVTIKRLDDVNGAAEAIFAKLDVEGYEDEVISGSADTLASSNLLAIQCESHSPRVTDALMEHGFVEYYYDPESRTLSTEPYGYANSNALFVRDAAQIMLRVKGAPQRSVFGSWI